MEKRVGVSFIRAEAATEAIIVSIDSSSKSSMSNESTSETSFVASATVLKERSLMGVAALGSFDGVGALGLLLKYSYICFCLLHNDTCIVTTCVSNCSTISVGI